MFSQWRREYYLVWSRNLMTMSCCCVRFLNWSVLVTAVCSDHSLTQTFWYRLVVWKMWSGGTIPILVMDAGSLALMYLPKCSTSNIRNPFLQLLLIQQELFLLEKLRLVPFEHILKDINLQMTPSRSTRPFLWTKSKTLEYIASRSPLWHERLHSHTY